MFKKIALIGILISIFSCAPKENGVYAEVVGFNDGKKVYLSRLGAQNNPIPLDTTLVENGKFNFPLPAGEVQELNVLTFEGINGNVILINEGEPMHAKIYKDSIRTSVVNGGKNNAILMEYFKILKKLNNKKVSLQEDMQMASANSDNQTINQLRSTFAEIEKENIEERKKLMTTNPQSVVSLMILSDLMQQKGINNNEAKETFANTTPEMKDHLLGRLLQDRVSKLNDTDVGSIAPDFSGPTPEGSELVLSESLGKLTLIDFWASWCRPCRIENPNIVNVYKDYKDKGFQVIGVSLDRPNQKNAWVKAIAEDELDWHHVSNLMFWSDPIALKYGVRSIPQAYILDENGVIIAKNLRGRQLRDKVAEYLDGK